MRNTVRLAALLAVVLALAAAGCGGGGEDEPTTTEAATTTLPPQVTHVAPELEALLPAEINGTKLQKGSATGAGVFGGDAFSREMTERLQAVGKAPAEMRFANAQDPKGVLEFEVGVFEVPGMPAKDLADAIVASTRPNAPGLIADPSTLGGKDVTTLIYPGGTVLYLYPKGERVFYIGTQNRALAEKAIGLLP
jgi:hypothetical protein